MNFVPWSKVVDRIRGKRVAIVGSGPSSLDNTPGVVDGHDIVVRVNGYKLGEAQGFKTSIYYSFFGNSIRKTAAELERDGVTLCICKCPDSKPLASKWHERNGKQAGIDFRYIYRARAAFWFCDTFVPDDPRFLAKVKLLQGHIPTTGFAAILDVLDCEPSELLITGFDFFRSGLHNVDEQWKPGRADDPIGHRPELEAAWVKANAARFVFDRKLRHLLRG